MTENKNTFDSDDSNKILINTDFEKIITETAIAGKNLRISYLISLSILFLLILFVCSIFYLEGWLHLMHFIIIIITLVLLFIPSIFLKKFSKAIESNIPIEKDGLEIAFLNLNLHFKYLALIMLFIICALIYLIFF